VFIPPEYNLKTALSEARDIAIKAVNLDIKNKYFEALALYRDLNRA
jgi:hypothetical protein